MIKVRAIQKGYYRGLREEDSVFDVRPEDAEATWFVPLSRQAVASGKQAKPAPKPEKAEELDLTLPTNEDAAMELTNEHLRAILEANGIQYAQGDKKVELVGRIFNKELGGQAGETDAEKVEDSDLV